MDISDLRDIVMLTSEWIIICIIPYSSQTRWNRIYTSSSSWYTVSLRSDKRLILY